MQFYLQQNDTYHRMLLLRTTNRAKVANQCKWNCMHVPRWDWTHSTESNRFFRFILSASFHNLIPLAHHSTFYSLHVLPTRWCEIADHSSWMLLGIRYCKLADSRPSSHTYVLGSSNWTHRAQKPCVYFTERLAPSLHTPWKDSEHDQLHKKTKQHEKNETHVAKCNSVSKVHSNRWIA